MMLHKDHYTTGAKMRTLAVIAIAGLVLIGAMALTMIWLADRRKNVSREKSPFDEENENARDCSAEASPKSAHEKRLD